MVTLGEWPNVSLKIFTVKRIAPVHLDALIECNADPMVTTVGARPNYYKNKENIYKDTFKYIFLVFN